MNPHQRPQLQGIPGGRAPQQPQQQHPTPEQARMQLNPMPNDKNLIPTLRGLQQCKVAQEMLGVNKILTELVQTRDEQYLGVISEGIIEGMKTEFSCAKMLEERTMANLAEDATLLAMLTELRTIEEKMTGLQQELDTHAKRMQDLGKNLWTTTVKNYGLTPEQRSYTFDEDGGVVKQVSLNCEKCPVIQGTIDIRKKLAAALLMREHKHD
jgi:hypothetical protein